MISSGFGYAHRLCLALCLLASGVQARDYELKVHVLNGRTGEPFANRQVTLIPGYEPGVRRGLPQGIVSATTSSDGIASFAFSDPVPGKFGLTVIDLRECLSASAYRLPIQTEEVLRNGVVEENTCDKRGRLKGKVVAKPGELVVFMEPISWWRRLIPIK